MAKKLRLALVFWIAFCGLASAQGTEVQLPDGQTVLLYDDHTWEFKRPAPAPAEDTVEVDNLVENAGRFVGEEVVVTGTVVRFLGAYRLQSSSAQNTIVLDVGQARRADQIALEQALAEAGIGKSVRVQVRGEVERSLVTSRLVAEDLSMLSE
jgi:hypothetical protein